MKTLFLALILSIGIGLPFDIPAPVEGPQEPPVLVAPGEILPEPDFDPGEWFREKPPIQWPDDMIIFRG